MFCINYIVIEKDYSFEYDYIRDWLIIRLYDHELIRESYDIYQAEMIDIGKYYKIVNDVVEYLLVGMNDELENVLGDECCFSDISFAITPEMDISSLKNPRINSYIEKMIKKWKKS